MLKCYSDGGKKNPGTNRGKSANNPENIIYTISRNETYRNDKNPIFDREIKRKNAYVIFVVICTTFVPRNCYMLDI